MSGALTVFWPLCLATIALFLRTYHLTLMGWVPDTYERLAATQKLLRGEFPLSPITPPGVSFVMAPFFAVLPQTVETMQAVTIAAGIGLVLIAYVAMLKLTGDRLAAVLVAFAIAVGPRYVYASRDGLFDIIVSFLLAVAVFGLPLLRGRSAWAFVAYGFLLGAMVNIRPTNAVCFPALGIYWLYLNDVSFRPADVWRCFRSPNVMAACTTVVAVSFASVVLGGWFGRASGAPLTFDSFAGNVVFYSISIVGGPLGFLCLVPLAIAGGYRLWRTNRGLALAVLITLVVWPLALTPFHFQMARYVLPVGVFFYFLAAMGPREIWRLAGSMQSSRRPLLHLYAAGSLAITAILFVGTSMEVLHRWPTLAARSDAGLARELRPTLEQLEPNSLLVTAVAGPFRGTVHNLAYFDLIDNAMERGIGPASQAYLSNEIESALNCGTAVYYLYSRWEAGDDFQGDGRDNYLSFFETVQHNFQVEKVLDAPTLNLGEYVWTLYRVEAKQPGAGSDD
jgi:hypothetical protein